MMITTTVQDVDLGTDWNLTSLGLSLTDTLDDLINEGRIEPQLAMKILSTFDKVVTEVLAEKVRARLTFKVHSFC
jgi:transcription initiation factor TFIIA small subunit